MQPFEAPLLAVLAILALQFQIDVDCSRIISASFKPNQTFETHRSSPELHNFQVHQDTGEVYIGATNWVFQLDSKLNLLACFKTAPENFYAEDGNEEDGDNINRLLVTNYKMDELIACDSVTSGCIGLSLTNVSVRVRGHSPARVTGNRDNFAFVGPGPTDFSDSNQQVLYVGAGGRFPAISSYSLLNLDPGQNWTIADDKQNDRDFLYGFSYNGFSYFVSKRWRKGAEVFTLVRPAKYEQPQANEVQFSCRSPSGKEYQILNRVQVLKPGWDVAEDLNLKLGDEVLFAMFSSDGGNGTKAESALCIYTLEGLQNRFDGKRFQEQILEEAAMTFDAHVTVFAATSVGDATVLYLGTHDAMFKKVLLRRDLAGGGIQYAEDQLNYPLSLKFEMSLDPTGEHLFFMTSKIVYKIQLFSCSGYSRLEACVGAGDPHCGWCTSTSQCTTKAKCKPNGSWISCTSRRSLVDSADATDPQQFCYCPTTYFPSGIARNLNCSKESEGRNPASDDPGLKIIIGVSATAIVIGLIVATVIIVRRLNTQEEGYRKALELFLQGDEDAARTIENPAEQAQFLPFNLTIPPEDINMSEAKQIGSGQFGAVYVAQYKSQPTAVKVVKHGSDQEQMKEFLKEIKVMAYIGHHPHIVRMIGAEVTQLEKRGVLVVLELSRHGDLESYLRKNTRNFVGVDETAPEVQDTEIAMLVEEHLGTSAEARITLRNLVDWCRQIASGLEYLLEKQIVHGDLAARNILLFEDGVVKVSDFGFSRKTYGGQYSKSNKETPLPFRWLAPETLDQMVFTAKTDVWAYGVTCWEIFTMGNCPFANETWTWTFKKRLREGMRLEKPELATEQIYDQLMMKCWLLDPEKRPDFRDILGFWQSILEGMEVANDGSAGIKYAALEWERRRQSSSGSEDVDRS